MSLFKCKMCGGDLEIAEGVTIAECEYCGTKQTVPKALDENLQNLFNRANTLRIKSEFDKAEKLYEKIIQADTTQSEAYWGLILCKYGIEYVDDPATFKKIPTCHRASYDSIIADDDYRSAIENADAGQRAIYEEQAREIDRIQKDILALAQREEKYDVFICYKETDSDGRRTQDSVIANDIYYQLTQEGFKVFYAAITLEGKLGSAYEPIIFAALNSAKVMLSIGTRPEYFNAVWVKNEWSRFLKIIKKDRSKLLIPCYRDMDAYELPEEFAHLQAQDMSKIGFINDLVRGIKKVIQKDKPETIVSVAEPSVTVANANIAPLLKRALMFLEDGEFAKADDFCEQILNQDPENAEAYLGKLMAELHVKKKDDLKDQPKPFDDRNNYQKVIRFADEKLKSEIVGYIEYINDRNETARLEGIYNNAANIVSVAKNASDYRKAADLFQSISEYRDSAALAREYYEKAETMRLELIYSNAKNIMTGANDASDFKKAEGLFKSIGEYRDSATLAQTCCDKAETVRKDEILADGKIKMSCKTVADYSYAITLFESVPGWRNADELIEVCRNKIKEINANEEALRLKMARLKARRKRIKIMTAIVIAVACAIGVYICVLKTVIVPNAKYNKALELIDDGDYIEAYETLIALDGYKDSAEMANSIYGKYKLEKRIPELKSAKVGDYVSFGAYDQDNNIFNGKEEIEWLVLDVKDDRVLVISKYALEYETYHSSFLDITWEDCSLRSWLNETFLNTAFSDDEKKMIPAVTVTADNNPGYSTNPGADTKDRVFLLSIEEANTYFSSDSERACELTTSYGGIYGWWLRSPGYQQTKAAIVGKNGEISNAGFSVIGVLSVRPALWINIGE